MTEMTDYEVNLRLAEIAGVEAIPWLHKPHPPYVRMPGFVPYSPLTDWSQLGPLVESTSEIKVFNTTRRRYRASCYMPNRSTGGIGVDTNKMKAICLAIIAAHEE